MSYIIKSDIHAGDRETVVELDDGTLAAVQCAVFRVGTSLSYQAQARALNADGSGRTDSAGQPIATELQITDGNPDRSADMARDCLRAVLGEPLTLIQPTAVVQAASIRQAIALATVTTGAVDPAALL